MFKSSLGYPQDLISKEEEITSGTESQKLTRNVNVKITSLGAKSHWQAGQGGWGPISLPIELSQHPGLLNGTIPSNDVTQA